MKVAILFLKFLFVGALFIVSNNGLHLNIETERNLFFETYYSWLGSLFDNFYHLTGYVTEARWVPDGNVTYKLGNS